MDARVTSLEASLVDLPSLIAFAIDIVFDNKLNSHLEARLPLYFEQFRRELICQKSDEGLFAPPITNCPPPYELDQLPHPRSPNLGGGASSTTIVASARRISKIL